MATRVVCLGSEGCPAFAGLMSLDTWACLGPTVTFGFHLSVLPFALWLSLPSKSDFQ